MKRGNFSRDLFSRSSPIMDIKCILILSIILIGVRSQDSINGVEDCFHIYDCCRKIENDCVEYCEPKFLCISNATSQELELLEVQSQDIETTTFQTPDGHQVIPQNYIFKPVIDQSKFFNNRL